MCPCTTQDLRQMRFCGKESENPTAYKSCVWGGAMKRIFLCLVMALALVATAEFADARGGRSGGHGGYGGGGYSSSASAGSASAEAGEMTYSGNVKSLKYHNSTCKHFNCRTCTKKFNSAEAAQKAGYTPCGWCGG